MNTAFWFHRDYRLQDNIALNLAIEHARETTGKLLPIALVDQDLFVSLAGIRQHSWVESLRALQGTLNGALSVIKVAEGGQLPSMFAERLKAAGVTRVFATRAFDPGQVGVQKQVGQALKSLDIDLFLHDSYYAVAPGTVRKPDGTPYKVYTPFWRNWMAAGWEQPQALRDHGVSFTAIDDCTALPQPTKPAPYEVTAGEAFALRTWERFKARALDGYKDLRDRADLSGTSHLSHALAWGEIHPRTLLAELGDQPGHEVYRKELAWREFYADVLWHNPTSETKYLDARFAGMRYDTGTLAEQRLEAWKQGKTGFPMVDAGMRQLLATGWMHNRVRMIVASFLVKDLHLEWQQGAEWFEQNLADFDPASNSHGWQWTAGCGTDASPYYRIFNPITQGLKFDPDGNYVRKFVPELAGVSGSAVHEPWLLASPPAGYPVPIVDHAAERNESLARLEEIKVSPVDVHGTGA
jgi:deoxyribodipyrimidine photo-lyase